MEEPEPMTQPAMSSSQNELAHATSRRPMSDNPMPTLSEKGIGLRSVTMPTSGWSRLAVTWKAKVIRPIWLKLRFSVSLMIG